MGKRALEKELVDEALGAIKKALGHLSRVKIEAAQSACLDQSQIMLLYTRMRRLQDYMQLASATSSAMVEIDLTDHDDELVTACLLFAIGEGEVSGIRRGVATGKSGSWTRQQAELLAALTIEFANRSVELLPGVSPAHSKSLLVQRVMCDIDKKTSGNPKNGARLVTTSAGPTRAGAASLETGVEQEAGFKKGAQIERLDFKQLHQRATGGLQSPEVLDAAKDCDQDAGASHDADEDDTSIEDGFLLDPQRIRDPRLRKMMIDDMRGLRRCREARDFRMASVHLCSILEQATFEYAMPRATELGLVGPIDNWRLPVILVQLLGDDLDEEDRTLLRQLLTIRNLLYPAVQLLNPREVSANLFSDMLQLTRQMLACLSMKSSR